MEKFKWAWEEFKKRPIIGLLFAAVISLGYMYRDLRRETAENKSVQLSDKKRCDEKVSALENQMTLWQHEKQITDSTLSALNAQWKLMEKLGYIKIP